MDAVVEHADHQEQRAETMPWLSIWKIAPSMPCVVMVNAPSGHEAHVRDRGIGDQLLHVLLRERHQGGIDDGDDAQPKISGANWIEASGNIGSEKRRKP
jgi:hypothetical protein